MKDFSPSRLGRLVEGMTSFLPERLARSVRWRYFNWAPKVAAAGLDVEVIGFRWRLHPADNLTERLIWLHRAHPEKESLRWALAVLSGKSALIVDVGANCGAFAVPLTAAASPESRTVAFEPNPIMFERLKENLHLNSLEERVAVHAVALGPESGEAILSFSSNLGEATLRSDTPTDAHQVSVPVRPLSDFLHDASSYEVVLLKIDVEGFEPEVLSPFFSTTKSEFWPTHIIIETEHSEGWSSDVSAMLTTCGYSKIGMHDGNTLLERRRSQRSDGKA